ncbi:MAG: SIS domain-containing protein [Actinomycetota bacterium]|nr:SIS domain-containing protein [Actinomycetota bacterium]
MNYEDAVASQPENLESTRGRVREGLAAGDLAAWRAGTLAVVAMGAGSHASWALVDSMRRKGRRAVSVESSALLEDAPPSAFADSFVLVSEGGRSSETVGAASRLEQGVRLGLTNVADSPLARAVDLSVTVGHGEDSPVYTVGYTATLQAFGILADELGAGDPEEDFAALPDQMRTVLAKSAGKMADLAARVSGLGSLDFVGRGSSYASASEAALLFREATRTPTAAFETRQYLHGPMESLGVDRGCVVFGDGREVELARYVAARGLPVVLLTSAPVPEQDGLVVVPVPPVAPVSRAVLEIVPVQQLAGGVARERGLGIDGFVYRQDDTKLPE